MTSNPCLIQIYLHFNPNFSTYRTHLYKNRNDQYCNRISVAVSVVSLVEEVSIVLLLP